ncbi:hypothetical protein CQA57_03260 [Helicobacter anseris]|uniref:Highly acidic protein n=1 Tax=Helicobacter anseris TaxID=375926 RepID=A0A3D8J9Z2_9HELI|nr:hypothetical protein [Helicobacter anseris]RDU74120.1 hypothetical protein CQA57_03260 [Helicobacter anseris]
MNLAINDNFFFLKKLCDDLRILLFEDDEYDNQEDVFEDDEDENHGYYNGYDDDDYQNPDSDYEDE